MQQLFSEELMKTDGMMVRMDMSCLNADVGLCTDTKQCELLNLVFINLAFSHSK